MGGGRMTRDTLHISNMGGRYEPEEGRQIINNSTCCVKEASQLQLLKEKQAIMRREADFKSKSETERGPMALSTLAPIQRLSYDVLRHIFELRCQDSPAVSLRREYLQGHAPPQIILSHVCSAWREIMLDVPTFWRSVITVPSNFSNGPPEIFGTVVKAANTLLSRAKGIPCSVCIIFPPDDEYGPSLRPLWEMDWHENIIRDLISLHKIKKLRVTFTDHHLRDLLRLPDDKLSCVEELYLRYITPNENPDKAPFDLHKLSNLMFFSLLPDPFDLYPARDHLEDYFKFASIPWHNLRHIQLHATTPVPFCLDVLEHCSTALETCSLVITGDRTLVGSSPRVPVNLFRLRKLKVVLCAAFLDDTVLESFLLSLRFPNLKSLILGSSDYPLYLEYLLRMVKARSRVSDRDDKHWIEATELEYASLYCRQGEDEIEDEILDLIEEVKLSGVELDVNYFEDM